jgi:hypothetical protein
MQIDTGDTVKHGPTGETWLLAVVDQGRVIPCGWPLTYASLSDCTLVKAATDVEREALLNQMADMKDDNDPRCRHARWRLGIRPAQTVPGDSHG